MARGRKARTTFKSEVEGITVELVPSIFDASELGLDSLIELANKVVRQRAMATFKKRMAESIPAIPIYRQRFEELKAQMKGMDENQILTIAQMIDPAFTLDIPVSFTYSLSDFEKAEQIEEEAEEETEE